MNTIVCIFAAICFMLSAYAFIQLICLDIADYKAKKAHEKRTKEWEDIRNGLGVSNIPTDKFDPKHIRKVSVGDSEYYVRWFSMENNTAVMSCVSSRNGSFTSIKLEYDI